MIKFIYRLFRQQFHNLLIEDLLLSIPSKVSKPAIEILGGKKETLVKWLYFEANSIFRRRVIDFGNLERRNGMLIMIQAMILLVNGADSTTEEHPTLGDVKPIDNSWRKDVQEFKKGIPPKKEETK